MAAIVLVGFVVAFGGYIMWRQYYIKPKARARASRAWPPATPPMGRMEEPSSRTPPRTPPTTSVRSRAGFSFTVTYGEDMEHIDPGRVMVSPEPTPSKWNTFQDVSDLSEPEGDDDVRQVRFEETVVTI